MQSAFKKFLPHIWIIAGFAVLSILYCFPALQGKVLSSGDVNAWKAASHETYAYYDSTGINPLWTNSMFGGMPTYTIGIPKSNDLVSYIKVVITTLLAKPAYFFFIALLCFYILMNVMRVDRWLGVIGAFAYAFSTYNIVIINAGHDTKMFAIGYLPAVLAGLMLVYRGRWLTGAALLGISFALMVGTNHYQLVFYTAIIVLFYVVGQLIITIKNKESFKNFVIASFIALIAAGIGMGPNMASFLATLEYGKATMRGGQSELTINHDQNKKGGGLDKDYAFQWSNSVGETFCIIVPYLYGGSSSEPIAKAPESEALVGGQADRLPLYWGPQPFLSGPVYFGAVICFLFALGLMVIRSPYKWWMVAVCVLAIFMSLGNHFAAFNYFLFDHLPMYNKFRIPNMILVIPQLFFPLIGIWGLSEILTGKWDSEVLWKKIRLAAIITGGICLLLAFGGSAFFDFTNPAVDARLPQQLLKPLKEDRAALAMKSALTSAVYILIAAGLLWAFAKNKIGRNILMGGVALLIVVDLMSVALNYLNEDNYQDSSDYEMAFQPRPVDLEILKDKDPYYRVLDVTRDVYNDAEQAYFHKSIGGYSAAKMEIYQDLIDVYMRGAQSGGRFNIQVLNMLNTKYIIFPGPQNQPVFQPNPAALGNAWFVSEVKMVNSADEEMSSMKAASLGDTVLVPNAFDAAKTAIVRNTFSKELQGYQAGKDSGAAIKLTRYGLNELDYISTNSKNGLGVFSDIYYPHGWRAYVDEKEVPIIRANYVLRAIMIPAGTHKIAFKFHPDSYYTGNSIALICSLILIALALVAIYIDLIKKKPDETTPAK